MLLAKRVVFTKLYFVSYMTVHWEATWGLRKRCGLCSSESGGPHESTRGRIYSKVPHVLEGQGPHPAPTRTFIGTRTTWYLVQ